MDVISVEACVQAGTRELISFQCPCPGVCLIWSSCSGITCHIESLSELTGEKRRDPRWSVSTRIYSGNILYDVVAAV
jgi:hypothetical protein